MLFNEHFQKRSNEITRALMYDFQVHVSNMDYAYLEDPEIQHLSGRSKEVIGDANNIIDSIGNILTAVLSLFSVVMVISVLNPLVLLLILIIVIVNACKTKSKDKKIFELRKEFSVCSSREWAIGYMLHNIDYAKDNRLYKFAPMLINKMDDTQKEVDGLSLKKTKLNNKVNSFLSLTNLMQTVIVYIYLIIQVLKGLISVGTMTIYLSAVGQFSSSISSLMNAYLGLSEFCLKIEELKSFLELENNKNTGNLAVKVTSASYIEFKNVCFHYPGSEILAINNLNIKIPFDQKLCIVGANGAGKSTFVKLLTRLYDPTSGEILLDGVNIKSFNYDEYQALFATVFQDFAIYMLSLKENIILSKPYEEETFTRVCEEAHIASLIHKLKNGAETQIGKEIDPEGIEPSGGEEQRIAIARACYKGGEIFILDEPTAALDPNAEYEIYTQFRNMIREKCAVLITHRLSAVQLADKVAVFDDGQVVEYGTHNELYAKGGIYTEMFDKQAQFYRDESKSETLSIT
jgi:ATP-binding cassette subfamily B protein/ATP-binding cassette subfamily C protein